MLAHGGTLSSCIKYMKEKSSENAGISSTAENHKYPKKERPVMEMDIPHYVTKLEDTKTGGKFFCNPCQAHCNSDIQLSQHLSSKKHLEKMSGRKNQNPNMRNNENEWQGSAYGGGGNNNHNNASHSDIFCNVCKLNFSSHSVLQTHLSGSKHQRKLKSLQILSSLKDKEPCFEYDHNNGLIKCTLCEVVFHSPQHLTKHMESDRHKEEKGKIENGEVGGTLKKKRSAGSASYQQKRHRDNAGVGSEVTSSTDGSSRMAKKERPPAINIPSCVTKMEDNKAGGSYMCNPCQAHCNSDIQLSQHLASKKHLDKLSLFCDVCNRSFASKGLLRSHRSEAQHERKKKLIDTIKSLKKTDPFFEYFPNICEALCLLCDACLNSPQMLLSHVASEKHKEEKIKQQKAGGSCLPSQPRKHVAPPFSVHVPSFVSKLDDGSGNEKYLCNPCHANCNSEIQLSQHLSSKKHNDRLSGKNQNSGRGNWQGGWRGGSQYVRGARGGVGRGCATSTHIWESQPNQILNNNTNASNYNHSYFHPEPSLPSPNFNDSYGLSSLGRGSVNDPYTYGRSSSAGRVGRVSGGQVARNEPSSHHSEGPYIKAQSYSRSDTYSRSDYSDYPSGRSENINSYNRSSADNAHQGYRSSQSMGHASGRGIPYPYSQPISHSFVSGGTIMH